MPPKKAARGGFCDLAASRGVRLYYEVSDASCLRKAWTGEKEETLFLMLGSTADLRKTTDQQYINQLAAFFRVLAYDHRNTGQSTIKDEPCTMEDYADDAAALLEALLPEEEIPAFVLGVSFGGAVAQHLAIRHPRLVKKLVLCCCAAGGPGGVPFPIHEWYAVGVSAEERVARKASQANSDRDEAWKQQNPSMWEAIRMLMLRDELIGSDEPLRLEGVMRQLEARRAHDAWDQVADLQMDTLCCGSHKDNITPPELMRNLAERIGGKCESKLDFDWGHAFLAADTTAAPFINEWLRKPAGAAVTSSLPVWKVVGGVDKGGIVVRTGPDAKCTQAAERLCTGSLVEEVELRGDGRLRYRLLHGTGPAEGWALVSLAGGRPLLARAGERP